MRVLLDNCVVYMAKRLFVGHDVRHTRDMAWRHLQNGALIAAAATERFDVFVTTDKGIRHQHRMDALPLPVVEINTHLTRPIDIESVAHAFPAALAATATHRFVSIAADGSLELLAPREAS